MCVWVVWIVWVEGVGMAIWRWTLPAPKSTGPWPVDGQSQNGISN